MRSQFVMSIKTRIKTRLKVSMFNTFSKRKSQFVMSIVENYSDICEHSGKYLHIYVDFVHIVENNSTCALPMNNVVHIELVRITYQFIYSMFSSALIVRQ